MTRAQVIDALMCSVNETPRGRMPAPLDVVAISNADLSGKPYGVSGVMLLSMPLGYMTYGEWDADVEFFVPAVPAGPPGHWYVKLSEIQEVRPA